MTSLLPKNNLNWLTTNGVLMSVGWLQNISTHYSQDQLIEGNVR